MTKSQDKVLSFTGEERPSSGQISLLVQFSALTIALIVILSLLWGLFFIKRQKEILYHEKVNTGKMVLGFFAERAALPLLEGDTLALNAIVKEGKQGDRFLYVLILDNKKILKAPTDPAQITVPVKELETMGAPAKSEFTYRLSSRKRVLNLSRPVTFTNRNVGWVYLGLSLDFIDNEIKKETFASAKNVLFFAGMMLLFVIGTALALSLWLKRSENLDNVLPPGAERNQVAVLYAGVKGFKAYAAAKNPEEILQDLSEYVSIATKNILDNGGYVAQVVGDAVIGIFRSSPLQTDHTVRAVKSAMAMQKAFEIERGGRNKLAGKVGIGISSGVVLSGYIGSHAGKKLNYIGESFRAAYSLNTVAGAGEIVISKDVYQSVEKLASVEPLPPREMTQRTEAWESFRLRNIAEGEPP